MNPSPLRLALYVVEGALIVAALVLFMLGIFGAAFGVSVWAVLLFVGLACERWRYKPVADDTPGLGWTATDERFVDTETGKTVTVYFNATTGERRYIGR
jgi:hypothetical protein